MPLGATLQMPLKRAERPRKRAGRAKEGDGRGVQLLGRLSALTRDHRNLPASAKAQAPHEGRSGGDHRAARRLCQGAWEAQERDDRDHC
jgi:hypothetical protein